MLTRSSLEARSRPREDHLAGAPRAVGPDATGRTPTDRAIGRL